MLSCEVLQVWCLTNHDKHWKNMKLCYDVTILQKKPQHFMGILKIIYLTILKKSQWKNNQNGNYIPIGISQNEDNRNNKSKKGLAFFAQNPIILLKNVNIALQIKELGFLKLKL